MPAEKVRCACGCYVGKFYMNKHKQTKKHLKLMEVIRPSTLDDIMKAMNELEEKVDEILIPTDETIFSRPKLERPIASP